MRRNTSRDVLKNDAHPYVTLFKFFSLKFSTYFYLTVKTLSTDHGTNSEFNCFGNKNIYWDHTLYKLTLEKELILNHNENFTEKYL